MRILVCNDDGVHAEGLQVLTRSLKEISEDVDVVAPDRNRSGASNSLTLSHPIRIQHLSKSVISVQGTPTDCVHLAITGLLTESPDMVVSGINEGANLGDDILYSGTVAGAMEGRFLGLPAVAISLAIRADQKKHYYETAGEISKSIVRRLIVDPLPVNTILNVNVPNLPLNQIKGYEITRLGRRHRAERTIAQLDPRGLPIYWIGPAGTEQDAGPGTDFFAISMNKVSITPLHIDLTQYKAFDQLSVWVSGL